MKIYHAESRDISHGHENIGVLSVIIFTSLRVLKLRLNNTSADLHKSFIILRQCPFMGTRRRHELRKTCLTSERGIFNEVTRTLVLNIR